MGYGGWNPFSKVPQGVREFTEKGWKRASFAEWDGRWETLSVAARRAFVTVVKAPPQKTHYGYSPAVDPGVPANKFEPEVLEELIKVGFVRTEKARETAKKNAVVKPLRVVTPQEVGEFRTRVRAIERIGLLDRKNPGDLLSFINTASYPSRLLPFVAGVFTKAEIAGALTEADALKYLRSARWPGLVLKAIENPLAEKVLGVVRGSAEPLPIGAVAGRIKGADPAKVREAIDQLVSHMAVVEDLDDVNLGIEVGLLPALRESEAREAARTERPALVVCETPRDIGPETGPFIDDIRSILLEIASEPPRVRQDGAIFSKEVDRFLLALNPLPKGWTADREVRVNNALAEADRMKWTTRLADGKELRLQLTPKGQGWLSADPKDQYARIFETYRTTPTKERPDLDLDAYGSSSVGWRPYYSQFVLNDYQFLSSKVAVVVPAPEPKKNKGKDKQPAKSKSVTPQPEDILALRKAIGKALMALPEGVYHRLTSVLDHLTFRDKNVILQGRKVDEVSVFVNGNPALTLEDEYEAIGRQVLDGLIERRLIPFGCLRGGFDEGGNLCVARTPRLGAYFGLETLRDEPGPKAADGTKVVIQPDFSVVVIGTSTAVLADLAPFCERPGASKGPGAAVLKITRESVTRAVAQGLNARQILERVKKHVSHEPPANVLREIREWADRVKPVKTERRTLVRCPDRETADRILGLLKEKPERLNDTVLLLASDKFTPAERKKLRDNGVLVGNTLGDPEASYRKPYGFGSRRRSY